MNFTRNIRRANFRIIILERYLTFDQIQWREKKSTSKDTFEINKSHFRNEQISFQNLKLKTNKIIMQLL